MKRMFIEGRGLWTPGFATPDAWLDGEADETVVKPLVDIVASRMKRATSLMTRTAVEIVTQAGREAEWELDSFATAFGSTHGEIQIAVEQMVMMQEGSGVVSPARFKNSVHNTAAGLFSIAAKNKGFTTAIAAGPHTFAMSLLEAWGLLATGEVDRIVVSVTEETLPEPIASFSDHLALGAAVALTRERTPRTLGSLGPPSRGNANAPVIDSRWNGHTAEGLLRIFRALADGYRGNVGCSEGWVTHVEPASQVEAA
ncbi:MAG: beta-ketoacyl synthase chain length factor [Myxococcota bacterium]